MENKFWLFLENLINAHPIIIDRVKGSHHPKYPDLIYPLDYGFLEETQSMDGDGIDVWVGSQNKSNINGIFCTIDSLKRDTEIKIVIGCTKDEIKQIDDFHNDAFQAALWIQKKE